MHRLLRSQGYSNRATPTHALQQLPPDGAENSSTGKSSKCAPKHRRAMQHDQNLWHATNDCDLGRILPASLSAVGTPHSISASRQKVKPTPMAESQRCSVRMSSACKRKTALSHLQPRNPNARTHQCPPHKSLGNEIRLLRGANHLLCLSSG